MSDYWKKKMDELEQSTSQSYWDRKVTELENAQKRKTTVTTRNTTRKDEDDDIAPVKKEEERTWFQKGAFEDGFSLKNIGKAIIGSAEDLIEDVGTGIVGMGEKLVDSLATLAPYYSQSQFYNNGGSFLSEEIQEKQNEAFEQGKKTATEFVKKDLYDEEKLVNTIYSNNTISKRLLGADPDDISVFGEKSDALAQSAGQLAATAGLQAVGVPWYLTTGITSFGSEAESALKEGATLEEAALSGAISAGAEILTEKISGGIKFGGKTLDDALVKSIARGISNKTVRTLTKLGFDAAGEGFEEVLSGAISAVGQKISYAEDKELSELFTKEEALESFIGGAVLGGGMSGISAIKAKRNGVDFASGLTTNEQKVVDKEYKDRIAEAEKKGKVSQKQKAEIYDRVLNDIEKGYISTDSIEEVLGGESYKAYQDTVNAEDDLVQQEKTLTEEYNKLNKMVNEKMTGEQQVRRDELRTLLPELRSKIEDQNKNSKRGELKTKLSDEVKKLVASDRLFESYNEIERKKQAFQADLSQYDQKQQAHIKEAIESGVLNNSNRTHDVVEFTAKVSADTGIPIRYSDTQKMKEAGLYPKHTVDLQADGTKTEFDLGIKNLDENFKPVVKVGGVEVAGYNVDFKNGKITFDNAPAGDVSVTVEGTEIVNAVYTKDGIVLNVKSPKYLETLTGHEVFHSIQNAKLDGNLKDALKAFAEARGDWESRLNEKQAKYKGIKDADPDAEVMADLLGEYVFEGRDFIMELATKDRNVFQKVYDEIKHLVKVATAGSKEARRLAQVEREFEKVYRELAQKNTADGGTQYNIDRTKSMTWAEQVQGALYNGKNIRRNDTLVVGQPAETAVANEIDDKPLAIPLSVMTKASSGKDISHSIKKGKLAKLDEGIKNAPFTIVNPERNSVVYVTDIKQGGLPVLAAFEMNTTFDGDEVHKATSIHLQVDVEAMLKNLPETATVYVRKNELDPVGATNNLRGLAAKIKFIEGTVAQENKDVKKQFSLSDVTIDDLLKMPDEDFYQLYGEPELDDDLLFDDDVSVESISEELDVEPDVVKVFFRRSGLGDTHVADNKKAVMTQDRINQRIAEHGAGMSDYARAYITRISPQDFIDLTVYETERDRNRFDNTVTGDHGNKMGEWDYDKQLRDSKDPPRLVINTATGQIITHNGRHRMRALEMAGIESVEIEVELRDGDGYLIKYGAKTIPDMAISSELDTATETHISNIIPFNNAHRAEILQHYGEKAHSDAAVKFSLSEPVEETKDLMAIHNLHSSELLKQLQMGGMPYPSVAITKPEMISHDNFGEVSIILNKDAIDPKKSKYNKVYSADAYTPTFPNVDYEASEEAASRIAATVNKWYSQLPDYYQRSVRSLRDYDNINDELNRWGGEQRYLEKYVDDDGLKQVYLAEHGGSVPVEMKSTETRMTDYQMQLYQTVADKMGADVLKSFNEKGTYDKLGLARMAWLEKHGDALKDIYAEEWSSDGTMTKAEALEIANEQNRLYWRDEIGRALKFIENGGVTVTETEDIAATKAKINDRIANSDYSKWVEKLFSGIEGRSGIRNNKDIFTPSGTRRSFAQTHDPLTIDNIVKAMRKENQTGQGAFGSGSILGASAKEFGSIAEIKRNADKLGKMDNAEHDTITDRIQNTFWDISRRYANGKDIIDAQATLAEAVSKSESKAGIARYLQQFDYVYKYDEAIVDEIIELRDYIRSLPTPYFEAKPRRGVGFDEVAVFVIPYDADVKLKQELLNRGYNIAEYDPKVDGDRQRVVNQFEEFKFSLLDAGNQPQQSSYRATLGKDVALEAPAQEEVAPVVGNAKTATVSNTESVAPANTEPYEEMFPDDTAPIQEEYEHLLAEREDIKGAMDAYAAVGNYDGAEQLMAEYEAVQTRIAEIEADDADRFASIEEADAPPEMDNMPEDVADDVPLTKALVVDLAKQVKAQLGLGNSRTAEVRELIERYSKEEFPSKAHLFTEIQERFGTFTEIRVDEDLKDVKARLRTYGINVDDTIKADIADYGQLMRSNFGKVRFSKEGLPVDVAYREFQEVLPGYFPESIDVPTDQLLRIIEVANLETKTELDQEIDWQTIEDAADTIMNTVAEFKQNRKETLANRHGRESFQSLMESADQYVPPYRVTTPPTRAEMVAPEEIAPTFDTLQGQQELFKNDPKQAEIGKRLARDKAKLQEEYLRQRAQIEAETKDKNAFISNKAKALYQEIRGLTKGVRASEELGYLLDYGYEWSAVKAALVNIQHTPDRTVNVNSEIENIARGMLNESYENRVYDIMHLETEYNQNVAKLEAEAEAEARGETKERTLTRKELHEQIVDDIKTTFGDQGYDFDEVLKNAKDLSTFATVDNTPQRVMEKALGYKEGQVLSDLTVNKVAQNETEGIRWLNSFTDKKSGLLAKFTKKYHIKPGSKESAAAQMYAEGFYVGENDAIIAYGDAELAKDFPDVVKQAQIKGLARDPRIRQIYDETLAAINKSRARNAYPEIPRLDNYYLHFRAMEDTFSRIGLPFNPNDIRAKDLPTDLNGVTADLKPGQPYFASAMHRTGKRTSFDLLGGLEKYLTSAKNQIYHIDDIQTLRALRNYVAETYGQAHGLENLDTLSDEEAEQRIKDVYDSHLSTFAKFLNEEANVLAGKTSLIDRGLEGIIGRRGITFLDTVNRQVGANMVGFNVSSSLTNFLAPVQAFAKTNKFDFVKAMAQTAANKLGKGDNFAEESPVMIRRKGAERFYRTPYQKVADAGYVLMGVVDDISTELIARTKYNEFTRKGMDSQQAHIETDKWVSRLMGDRSLGQQPQLYNSKMLGLFTKFQLEVRNQLDSQFYDTIQEAKVSTEEIENKLQRNATKATKIASAFVQLAVMQHLFGKAFESVAGYNPAFDIIEALIKTFGWDDEEDDEDTVLDNLEQGFMSLLEDLPYTSTLTGGRIPISSALPVAEFIKGKDQYGNEKNRWQTLGEAAPYYVLPGGYGQIKKTRAGLKMFDEDLPIAGSYTDSGNLRFPVDDTLGSRVQAGLFGQWASENARDYFDNERAPLKEKQIQELIDTELPIRDYWDYREGLSKQENLEEKVKYIESLDLPIDTKNILVNNVTDRKNPIDLTDYDQYGDYEEFDFASKNPEKYDFLQQNNVAYTEYTSSEDAKEFYDGVYSWVKNNPEKVTVSKAVTNDVVAYRQYAKDLDAIRADKDADGKTISGSAKAKKLDYINSLDIDYGARLILFKNEYNADDTYNYEIIDYLNAREDISFDEMNTILRELGFNVTADGMITW